MSGRNELHLSEDQFAACALETPDPVVQAHLDECGSCRAEVAAFRTAMSDFSQTAMHWSESKPVPSLRAAAREPKRQPVLAYAGMALAAGLALAVATPMLRHHEPEAAQTATACEVEDSPAQIAEDNRMMAKVNTALAVTDASPFFEYQLTDAGVRHVGARAEVRSE